MEQITFSKMHGAGNDFIVIAGTLADHDFSPEHVRLLCSRKRGIGADGLLLLSAVQMPAQESCGTVEMIFFNCDGSRAELCGNGLRCAVGFSYRYGLSDHKKILFKTDCGNLWGEYLDESSAAVQIRVNEEFKPFQLQDDLLVYKGSTGVPHAVLFVEDIDSVDVRRQGAELRYHKAFQPDGANVDFVQKMSDFSVPVPIRTYERGVEDETLACGTGAVA